MRKRKILNAAVVLLLSLCAIVTIFPILWILITSLKTDVQMFSIPPDIFPHPVTFKHYQEVILAGNFLKYLFNSIIVAVVSCGISMLVGIPAAYGFAKFSSRSMKPVFGAVTAVRMVPQVAMVIPFFMIMRNLKLSDTVLGLIITYIPFELTLIIWMLKNFFAQIPKEVEEAAELDGLGVWGTLIKVAVPLSKSSIGVAGLMAFLFSWNEFMFALSLTSTAKAQTLTIGIAGYVTSFQTFWGSMSATGILFMIPALILTVIFQKDLVKGLTAGAVKG
jgi:multiple sugar transport system permease protein